MYISAVEFVEGPFDGLRLVKGIEKFKADEDSFYMVQCDHEKAARYRPREAVSEDGILYLDLMKSG